MTKPMLILHSLKQWTGTLGCKKPMVRKIKQGPIGIKMRKSRVLNSILYATISSITQKYQDIVKFVFLAQTK